MSDKRQASAREQAKSWKAIQAQVQTLAKKAQQVKTEKTTKSQ